MVPRFAQPKEETERGTIERRSAEHRLAGKRGHCLHLITEI
jgi:hypothetical protein